ncbi:MAG: hypothetical protein EOO90_07355 [Pedobacter sp.]|nr:MAG: hypothetical protein EOO90_07355 [Pedobacter sp.]
MNEEPETFCPKNRTEWRDWLNKNSLGKQSVWLIYFKKSSQTPSISYSEAVDEALCFGWIDSTRKSLDEERFMQFFCKRKPNSGWSKINKGKIEVLTKQGLMTKAGQDSIETAKQNGSWTILDEVEELLIPQDLELAFLAKPGSADYFSGLSKSNKKMILQWIAVAKRAETRTKRIDEIVDLASKKQKPKFVG